MRQPSVLACNRAPQASLSIWGEGAAPYAAPPYNRGSPTWAAPGGGLTSSSSPSKLDLLTSLDQQGVVVGSR